MGENFIYVFNTDVKDKLLDQGYVLFKEAETDGKSYWVFFNTMKNNNIEKFAQADDVVFTNRIIF